MSSQSSQTVLSKSQTFFLILLRIVIGWHLLFEGLVKVFKPGWSSFGYLMDSKGWVAPVFQWMAQEKNVLAGIDLINQWVLVLIGLALILGLFTRLAAIGGSLLLLMYFASHPSLIGVDFAFPTEGNYLWINKTLIEAIALMVIASFKTGKIFGLDRIFSK